MEKELKELIKDYEIWLKAVKQHYNTAKEEFDNYHKPSLHTAYLAKEQAKYEREYKTLEIVLRDLKRLIKED